MMGLVLVAVDLLVPGSTVIIKPIILLLAPIELMYLNDSYLLPW